jgi:putative ABC transport system permease protein
MLNVMLNVGDKVNRELKAYGANITVVPKSASVLRDLYGIEAGLGSAGQYMAEADVGKIKTIFWAHNIVTFAPFLEGKTLLSQDGREVTLVGTWFDHRLDLPTGEVAETGVLPLKTWWQVEGEWVKDDDQQGALIGSLLASKVGLRPGDDFEILSLGGVAKEKLKVRGIVSGGGSEDEQIFVPLALAQKFTNLPGKVGRIEVSAITTPENDLARKAAQNPKSLSLKEWETWYCTAYVSAIAYQIEEVVAGSRAKPIRQVAESEGVILQKTQLLMLLITVLSLIGSALGISNLLIAGVMERSREIGLLKALGATDGDILWQNLAEAVVAGIAGGTAGYFSGLGFAQIIGRSVFGSAVAVNAMVIPLVMVLVVMVILAGSLPAVRMLLSLRPAKVLHGR